MLSLLAVVMYAETHYRFRFLPSFLKKAEPEILADAPHRIEPGLDVPILVLLKDSHLHPATIHQITVTVSQGGTTILQQSLLRKPVTVNTKWWWDIHQLAVRDAKGWITIDVAFDIESNGRRVTYHNDNYRTSSKQPLRVYLADTPLPRLTGLHFGDMHVHSSYTDDQVEYGAPPEALVRAGAAIGLSFCSITDHSYDLDDSPLDYLVNEPKIPKWKSLQREVSELNRRYRNHRIILGEEVSCRNSRGENVHLLLYGNRKYVPGSGDSAEKWLRTRSEFSISEILGFGAHALAAAAHPLERVPMLQRLLLGRGRWLRNDLRLAGLGGIQFLNGVASGAFEQGKREWVRILLSGRRICALGGNDAHGNLSRFRQIKVPFLLIGEHEHQIFGRMRTGVFLGSSTTAGAIISAINAGRVIISDGPVGTMSATSARGSAVLGGEISGDMLRVRLMATSSTEFGAIQKVTVYCGLIGQNEENVILSLDGLGQFRVDRAIPLNARQSGYIRLEIRTSHDNTYDNSSHFCLTNPLWFNRHPNPQ